MTRRAPARRTLAPDEEWNHFNQRQDREPICCTPASRVHLGAHGQREGLGAHWEMWMLVQGGMTPLEALRCATLNGARYLGLDKDIGSLEPGKLADLVVLDANPLDEHPQHASRSHYTRRERPRLRRRHDERDRQPPAHPPAVLLRGLRQRGLGASRRRSDGDGG